MSEAGTEAAGGTNGGVEQLRRELAYERRELAAAVDELERAVDVGRRVGTRRLAIVGGALVLSFVLAGGVSALARGAIRRRQLRRRDDVVMRVGDLALVRRGR
jgi:outer membrane murein-binding lipoprotein Lpp